MTVKSIRNNISRPNHRRVQKRPNFEFWHRRNSATSYHSAAHESGCPILLTTVPNTIVSACACVSHNLRPVAPSLISAKHQNWNDSNGEHRLLPASVYTSPSDTSGPALLDPVTDIVPQGRSALQASRTFARNNGGRQVRKWMLSRSLHLR